MSKELFLYNLNYTGYFYNNIFFISYLYNKYRIFNIQDLSLSLPTTSPHLPGSQGMKSIPLSPVFE